MSETPFRSGFIAIVGRPNVGKSTLMNALTGEKVAIVSRKPQTTRNRILAMDTTDDYQMIFVDTPGVHTPRTRLGEYMNRVVTDSISDVDAAVLVVEAGREVYDLEREILEGIGTKIPKILVINKVDEVDKSVILPQIAAFSEICEFAAVVPTSAKRGVGVKALHRELLGFLPEGPLFYPDASYTDQTERQMVSEIIREKMLRLLDKEVPHGTAVEIESMKEDGALWRIGAVIYCEKDSHKPIIIGKKGETLKRIGSYARADIEKLLQSKVFLELWVKVKSDWRNSGTMLKELGYRETE